MLLMSIDASNATGSRPNPDVLWRVVGEEALLLDTVSGNYFSLDPIATEIWVKLTEGEPPEQIAAALSKKYSIEEDRARSDVDDLVSEMRDADIWR
jgi:Coenzyme PQQ synthesis protein D (PqqD)